MVHLCWFTGWDVLGIVVLSHWHFICQKRLHCVVEGMWFRLDKNQTFSYFPQRKLYSQSIVSIFIFFCGEILTKMWLVFYFIFHSGTIWSVGDSKGGEVCNFVVVMILYFKVVYKETWKDARRKSQLISSTEPCIQNSSEAKSFYLLVYLLHQVPKLAEIWTHAWSHL